MNLPKAQPLIPCRSATALLRTLPGLFFFGLFLLFHSQGYGEARGALAPSAEFLAKARVFVEGADMSGCFNPAGGWKTVDGVVTGHGRRSFLIADHEVGKGNFDLELNLTLSRTDANYASLELGQARVVLGGDDGNPRKISLPSSPPRTTRACPSSRDA